MILDKRPQRTTLSEKNMRTRGIPDEYFEATFDEYPIDPDILKTVKLYVENFDIMLADNVSLIMYGVNGNGKTYLSSIIVKEAYRMRYTSYRRTLHSLVQLYFDKGKNADAKELWDDILDSDFLFIDEVGKEPFDTKQYNVTIFEEILRHRDTIAKPTNLCSNLPLENAGGLYDQYGKSITSLIEGKAMKLLFDGEDYRPAVSRNKRGIRILTGEDVDAE